MCTAVYHPIIFLEPISLKWDGLISSIRRPLAVGIFVGITLLTNLVHPIYLYQA